MTNKNTHLNKAQAITCWIVVNRKKEEDGSITVTKSHNHISDGWNEGDYPLPIDSSFSNQKSWASLNWEKKYAYLTEGKVIYKEEMTE